MKKLVHALALTGLVGLPTLAMAEEESPHKLSANVGMTSDYIFRGISQTGGDPAVQGGLDYTHSSGFYLGTWGSNVGWIEDYQGYGSGNVEIDLYGAWFRRRFGIENDQALELFHQTVSMKSVGNLTDFVRSHMLEPFEVAPRITALINHFDDLNRAHQAVLKAQQQVELLTPLVADCNR